MNRVVSTKAARFIIHFRRKGHTVRKIFSTALKAAAGLALAASANVATAATPITSGGKLTGATGVSVNSNLYTVSFVDGTCSAVFGGACDPGVFDFSTSVEAGAAASALLSQVFTGIYDLAPGLTEGCNLFVGSCRVLIPYEVTGNNVVSGFALNRIVGDTTGTGFQFSQTTDTTRSATVTYARFTLEQAPSAVPEPSTWLLMMAGFGVAGLALRRGKAADRRVAFA